MTTMSPEQYEKHRTKAAERVRAISAAGRDIGRIPAVKDHGRKREALQSYQVFLEQYFPMRFKLRWGRHHLRYIKRIERVIRFGGYNAVAFPRGDGKTTIAEPAPLWAFFTGLHSYAMLIGNSQPKAKEMLESIKTELQYNELLLEDFPEVCYPIKMLEGQARRAGGQTHYGIATEISWTPEVIRLPNIPGSAAAGATLKVVGMEGDIRGAVKTLTTGERIRPTLAILDDPQTDESARSPSQCQYRHEIITGTVAGLAGAGESMSIIVPCTIIKPGDLSDRLLDRKRSPDFTGERIGMLESIPTNTDLWDEYNRIRCDSLDQHGNISEATKFYIANREKLDEGGRAAWEERYDRKNEVSAIQSAMNLLFKDRRAFFAEYQNDPLPDIEPDPSMLTAAEIATKVNVYTRGLVPHSATTLVSHVDVQGGLLYWAVMGFEQDFTGYLVDYGSFPRQPEPYFTLATAKRTFADLYPKLGFDGRVFQAMKELIATKLGKPWRLDGGGEINMNQILIDAAWGKSTDTVHKFCRESTARSILIPAYGRYVGASSLPMNEYKRKRGEKVGHNWRIPTVSQKRVIKHALYDTNYWKTFLHDRLCVPEGEPGSLTLFQPDKRGGSHMMLAEHLTAEMKIPTEGRGRRVDEWKLVEKTRDNHHFDNMVGCCVAASMQGCSLPTHEKTKANGKRKRVLLSELQAQKRGIA